MLTCHWFKLSKNYRMSWLLKQDLLTHWPQLPDQSDGVHPPQRDWHSAHFFWLSIALTGRPRSLEYWWWCYPVKLQTVESYTNKQYHVMTVYSNSLFFMRTNFAIIKFCCFDPNYESIKSQALIFCYISYSSKLSYKKKWDFKNLQDLLLTILCIYEFLAFN